MTSLADKTAALRQWVKAGEHPIAAAIYRAARWSRNVSVPVIPALHAPLYLAHRAAAGGLSNAKRVLWFTPIFQARLLPRTPGFFHFQPKTK